MKTCRKIMAVLMIAAMVLSGMADIGTVKTAKAAKALKLSKTSVGVAIGKSKEVKIKNFHAKKVQSITIKSSKAKVASAKRIKNTIRVKGKKAGNTTVTIRIRLKNVKKATVLTLKVTVRDKTAGTDTQPSTAPGGNPQQTTPPTSVAGPTVPAGTLNPAGGSGGNTTTTPPTGGTGNTATPPTGTNTTPPGSGGSTTTTPPDSTKPSGNPTDDRDAGLYNKAGTLVKSWSALLEDGDIVVGDDEITDCDTGLEGVLKISAYVTSIGDEAFYNCYSLTGITIPEGVTSIGGSAFYNCYSLTEITIPEGVTSIGESAFRRCSSLTDITISEGVTSIERYAFSECSSLTEITIPEGVISIGRYAFSECSSLTEITIPDSVTSIGQRAFCFCRSLTGITIPDSVTSINGWAFEDCSGLEEIKVSEGNAIYSSKDNEGDECNAIIEKESKTLIVGCKNTKIPEGVTSIGGKAFSGCSNLTGITIPDSVTSINGWAFEDCSGLEEIKVSERNAVYSSKDNEGNECNAIIEKESKTLIVGCKNTKIPSGVTSIGNGAFWGCNSLTDITIPDSVTSIGSDAFYNVPHITYHGTAEGSPWGAESMN